MSDIVSVLPNDGQLISRLQSGDLESLGLLYKRHSARVYRTALAITRDSPAAEDILHDCFLRIHKYAHRIDNSLPLEPWLYRVTVNLAYTFEKRKKRWQTPLDAVLNQLVNPPRLSPERQAEMRDVQDTVFEAIAALSFSHRTVIVLYYLNSFSLKEIALILDCPVGTVKSRLHYGRACMQRKLEAGRRVTPEVVYEFT